MFSSIKLIENTVGTSIKLLVTPSEDAAYEYTKVWSSKKKVISWSQSAAEDVSNVIEITGLTKSTMYVLIPFAYDIADEKDEPGAPLYVIPTDSWTPWDEIIPALSTVLLALGMKKVDYGRGLPQKFKTPQAWIETQPRVELFGTNAGALEAYPVVLTVAMRGKDVASGKNQKARMEYFVDQLKYQFQRKRDYAITDLQLVTAAVSSMDEFDYDTLGVKAGITATINVVFQLWRVYRQ